MDAASSKCQVPARDDRLRLRASSLIIFGAALAAFILRLVAKFLHLSKWGADDNFMTIAAVLIIPLIILLQLMISSGLGRDLRTLTNEELLFCFKMFFCQQVAYFVVLGFVKASVLAFYLRIFPDHKFRIVVWATQFFNLTTAALYFTLILLQYNPISLNWTGDFATYPNGEVLSDKLVYLTHGVISMTLDVWMVILPFTQLYHLGLKLRKKVGVLSMFSCGILLTGASVTRFYYLVRYQKARNTEEAVKAIMWAYIELCIGVIVGCMPSIRQLTRRARGLIVARSGTGNTDPEQPSPIFRQRSLELITHTTTSVGIEKGGSGTTSSVSK
ncbi:hypothetical protein FLONG3_3496 [Fusarium longipes]|uniref:Rhodopsin domain-containing protein n=1 Tax=Fusarium longipes TaxID=694270 RepID=A0A395T110_9HYPO|nr:hypothetical protein FLONG3_3496 [Fusarium longipes]